MDAVGGALILLQGHHILGEDHPLALEVGRQGGVAENVILIDVVLVVVHGPVADAVGDVIAQRVAPPGRPPQKGRVLIGEENAAPKAKVLVEERQHLLGKIFTVLGQVQGKVHGRLVPCFCRFADNGTSFPGGRGGFRATK